MGAVDHPVQSPSVYRFGVFEVDPENRELRKHGTRMRLQDKPFQVLIELLRRPGEVVTRDELRQRLWLPGTFVDFDEGINTAVKRLRSCLGDSPKNPVYIETAGGYGYRFIAPVVTSARNESPVPAAHGKPEAVLIPPLLKPPAASTRSVWRRRWVPLSLVLVVAALAAVAVYRNWQHRSELAPGTTQSIAVLPLQNLSGDPTQEYFADGITDEITTSLARLAGPKVISRTSAMHYKGTHKTIPEIARDLNVSAIVEGSVEREGERVRVRVQLIQASTDRHLWAEEYDGQLSDVLQLEADVAHDIARQVQMQMTPQQHQVLSPRRPSNPQAFQDYLQGRHYWALRTKESLNQAIEYFNRAIQEDPNDARSYAGLAHCYIVMPMLTDMPASEGFQKAHEAAARALTLDDSLAEAHLAIAEVLLYRDWNFADAEREFRRSLELNPNYSTGHQWYAEYLGLMGRHEQAIGEVQKALALDPLSAIVHHQAANILRNAGRYDEAIAEYREALKISPSFYLSYLEMALALWHAGRVTESIQAQRTGFAGAAAEHRLNPAIISAVDGLQPAYAAGGKPGYLRQCLKVHRYFGRTHYFLAWDYVQLGDREAAMAELNRSYQDHDLELLWIFTDPAMDPLRSDPRFQHLIRAVGFPQQ
jgi:TolB-like protein/DNA-binding winged helix-turn-helix (wHTH) protein/Tfp pilus assembly protein PilF